MAELESVNELVGSVTGVMRDLGNHQEIMIGEVCDGLIIADSNRYCLSVRKHEDQVLVGRYAFDRAMACHLVTLLRRACGCSSAPIAAFPLPLDQTTSTLLLTQLAEVRGELADAKQELREARLELVVARRWLVDIAARRRLAELGITCDPPTVLVESPHDRLVRELAERAAMLPDVPLSDADGCHVNEPPAGSWRDRAIREPLL